MARLFAASLIALSMASCAPSLRGMQQSTAYFERCHGADFDPSVPAELKQECWATWLRFYTHGQPPDRVAYAETRRDALGRGETVEPLPGVPYAMLGSSYTAEYLTASEPAEPESGQADAEAEPPPDPAAEQAERERRHDDRVRPRPPGNPRAACASVCNPRWDLCVNRCEDRESGCMRACEAEHRTCMAGCY